MSKYFPHFDYIGKLGKLRVHCAGIKVFPFVFRGKMSVKYDEKLLSVSHIDENF